MKLEDLNCIANLSDNLFLFVKNGDENKENPLALQIDTNMKEYYIQEIQRFLKFTPFVESVETPTFYQMMVEYTFEKEELEDILKKFEKKWREYETF